MKFNNVKKLFITLGAGIAAAGILTACGNTDGSEEKKDETNVSQEADEKEEKIEPVQSDDEAASTESVENAGETTESAEAAADVYGDGADPVTDKSAENGLGFLREQLKATEGTICGFAYIGSLKEGDSVKDLIDNSDTAKRFTFIKDMDLRNVISDGGNDVFVFVPTDDKASVVVNTFAESDNGKTIYTSDKGNPIIVCTKDELNDSMEIVIADSLGNIGRFTPDITTGSVTDIVYRDFTAYNFSTDSYASKGLDKKYLLDTVLFREPNLNDLLASGAKLSDDSFNRIYIDDLEFYTLDFGRNTDGKFIKERFYAVSKDGTLVYRFDPETNDWMDLLAFDFNSEQYR